MIRHLIRIIRNTNSTLTAPSACSFIVKETERKTWRIQQKYISGKTGAAVFIRTDRTISLLFEYDRQFLRSGNALSPFRMPLSDSAYSFPAVERLCLTGPRGTGALEYVPEAAPAFSRSSVNVTETAAVISDWMRCAEKSGITEARAAEIAEGIRAANA